MPSHIDNLTPRSSKEEVQTAISTSISDCMAEGKTRDECVAKSLEIAKRKTGDGSPNPSIRAGLEA